MAEQTGGQSWGRGRLKSGEGEGGASWSQRRGRWWVIGVEEVSGR
jgi:hypothetical protein